MVSITKLTSTNYLTWQIQVQALLEAHELHGFLDDTAEEPSATVTANGVSAPNPLFLVWKRQDRMLYSALLGTLSLAIQPVVARAKTSREIWSILANTFAKPSRAHVKTLQKQLRLFSKGTQTIAEYMRNTLVKADQLALLGSPLTHEDLLDSITEGLGDDYRPIVEMVNGRDSPISIDELHEKLLGRESALATTAELSGSSLPVTANATQYPASSSSRGGAHYHRGGNNSSRGGYRNPRPYLGKCQLCGVQGHSAKRCNHLNTHMSALSRSNRGGHIPQWHSPAQFPSPPPHWNPQAHHTTASSDAGSWLLDSGASHHIASDLSNLSLHAPYQGGEDVMIGNGTSLNITHTGSSLLPSTSRPLSLTNVLCVPQMKKNLISVNKLCKTNNCMVQLCPYTFQVKDLSTGATLLTGKASDGVYEWPTIPVPSFSAFLCLKSPLSTWHSRLGHPSPSILRQLVSEFSLPTVSSSLFCNSCSTNKSHKLPFSNTSIRSSGPLDVIFTDVWTSPVQSIDGFKYYVIFVDHYTRYIWLYPLKRKSQVAEVFPLFKAIVENRFKTRITILYSDNGGEYIGLRSFLSTNGISHLTTPPHTPEHNGIAERRHRHIVETGLSLLSHASIPHEYWSYAFLTAVYLINRMPTPNLAKSSPFRLLFGTEPNYLKLRTFGCLCYPWLRPYGSNKFSPKSTPCVFLGYSLTQSAFFCLDVSTSRIFTSRHVIFHESIFPFSKHKSASLNTSSSQTLSSASPSATVVPIYRPPLVPSSPPNSAPSPREVHEPESSPDHEADVSMSRNEPDSDSYSGRDDDVSSQNTGPEIESCFTQPEAQTQPTLENTHTMVTRAKNKIRKPNPKYGLAAQLTEIEPKTVAEALKDKRWRRAMCDEIDAQVRNGTFDLVSPEEAHNIVGCRWVFTIKRLPDGSIDRFKARLVAKGFHQQPGVDFHETFSPVIKHATIRLVLGVAVARDWPLRQLDVNNAFLQGNLTEAVYMTQPPGFVDKDRPEFVCRLKKALYGLKQAPRAWYNELRTFLLSIGFQNSLGDASLFILRSGTHFVYMLVYVDDILVTGSDVAMVDGIVASLSKRFSLKDLGNLSYFLGLEAHRTSSGLRLTQQRYTTDLLVRTNMTDAKPVATPMCSSQSLTASQGTSMADPTMYRAVVGSLQYLALTRPDISFAVNRLSQFMHAPTNVHWDAAKRVLRYLVGTVTHGIFFSASTPLTLHAYSDADWAGDRDDYSSTGAYIVYLGKQPISWTSRKQKGVARSSTEAEYRSVADTAAELKWITSLASELGLSLTSTPTIFCDNIGATHLCANPVFHSRMKHIALAYHFVREQVQGGTLRVSHVSSADQLADTLTKPLPRVKFQDMVIKIGLVSSRPS